MTIDHELATDPYRLLIDSITDYAIYMLDPSGFVASWNPGAERFKRYRQDEVIGQHFSRFYTDEDRANGLPARALQIARSEGRFEKEGWRVRKDGTRFWAHVIIDPVKDNATGNIIGFAKITRDLTERKKAEDSLQSAREALYQSQKMESLGQLTGGVAHDFNNLLNAIIGSLELLRKPQTAERQTVLIDNALAGAERGIVLTQRMLSFARKQELRTTPVDIYKLVGGMDELLRRTLGPSVSIEAYFPTGLMSAYADAHQLELAVLNLAVNARDAMPNGGKITITAKNTPAAEIPTALESSSYVQLIIADEGSGMDPETLARAQEPFFTTKGVGKGTGLGLSMVSGMAEQLGGRLELKSELGKGTTAIVWLPAAESVLPRETAPSARAPVTGDGKRLKILAIDDDALILLNTAALLEDLGHSVETANSGSEAIKRLEAGEIFDLLITDHAMPQMTGSQLIEELAERRENVPVILASGYAELPPQVGKEVIRLSKPFWQADLQQAVAKAMKSPTQADATG